MCRAEYPTDFFDHRVLRAAYRFTFKFKDYNQNHHDVDIPKSHKSFLGLNIFTDN